MVRFLSSTKLAVALCLILSAEGAGGSILYRGSGSFGEPGAFQLFRSPLFLVPAVLLVLNILFCAGSRLRTLSARRPQTWSFAGIHLGLLLLIAGLAVDGLYGFVGTRYFPVGVPVSDYRNWRENREASLPFTVEVTDTAADFHPLNLQIGLQDGAGRSLGVYTVREGVPFRAGDPPVTIIPRKFDLETKTLLFDARADGRSLTGLSAGVGGSSPIGGYVVAPVAFRDPEPSGYRLRVRFTAPGGIAREAEIRSNRPAIFGGISFCLVGFDVDRYRNPIVGLQMTREPGAPLFWGGGLLFALSLLVHLRGKRLPAVELREEAEYAPAVSGRFPPAGTGPPILLLAAALGILPGSSAAAQLPHPGRTISGEETWQGEVRITVPVSVEKGGLLRILPGTRVLLSGEDADGDGCRDGYIQVFGTIRVEGERERPVRFARLDPEREWEEIFLNDAEGVIRYALFEGAAWGLHIHGGKVRVDQSLFRGNGGGARLRGTGASFSRCTFRGNGYGLRFWDGGPSVRESLFERNGTGLFYREGSGGATINGNRIAGNETDLRVGDWAAGGLDASRNWWGNGGASGRVRDFREKGGPGRVLLLPALDSPPEPCGTDVGILESAR